MRVNKKDPKHWYLLARSGANVVLSVPFRLFRKRGGKKRIVFYDQMNGNVEAFVQYLEKNAPDEYELYFLAFPEHHKLFPIAEQHPTMQTLSMLRFRDMVKVAQADAIITAFGIETLVYYQKLTDIKFIDVWHGVPYRGYTPQFFSKYMGYDQAWVPSPTLGKFYRKWGWAKEKIKVTGYARVDRLVRKDYSLPKLRKKYGIDKKFKKVVLIAPTWEQKGGNHNPFPFGASPDEFLNALNDTAKATNSLIVFRLHLQSGSGTDINSLSNVRTMPSSNYPDTEEILFIADVLVSDWSSIVHDYLPLHRPTIFLDVKYPFMDGYTVPADRRFGELVGSLKDLQAAIKRFVLHPDQFTKKYSKAITRAEDFVWGDTLDGKSAERYKRCLDELIQ